MPRQPVERSFNATAARLCYFEWGESGAPAILLIHATGFHARCWDETIRAMPDAFRVIAVDMRGHGRSEKTGPMSDWSVPAKDIGELVAHLNITDAIGAGHSMGGHTLVQIAAARPRAFKRLALIDPVMMTPEIYASPPIWPKGFEHPVARRRNLWASWQEMFDAFKTRHPYSLWHPQVLADYCRYGLLPKANGEGFELACPPAIEASIYMGSTGTDIYALAKTIDVPVLVLRAKMRDTNVARDYTDFAASPTWECVAQTFPKGHDVYLPELTHFIPMQEPELIARYILSGAEAAA
jgi:pimeloyl-ACP methyl ester carboxylesterase